MRGLLLLAALLGLATTGCGSGVGKVKGQLVENGQPKTCPPNSAIMFTATGADGKASKSFASVVNEDGTFEVVVSGGELTPGKYEVSIQLGMGTEPPPPVITTHREVKSGLNNFTIDLAKPGE